MGDSAPVGGEQLDRAIADAVASLHAQVRFAGRLEYGYNRRGRPMQRYNIARHAGTLYALAQHYERVPDARAAARRHKLVRGHATADAATEVRVGAGEADEQGLATRSSRWRLPRAHYRFAGAALVRLGGPRDDAAGDIGLSSASWCECIRALEESEQPRVRWRRHDAPVDVATCLWQP